MVDTTQTEMADIEFDIGEAQKSMQKTTPVKPVPQALQETVSDDEETRYLPFKPSLVEHRGTTRSYLPEERIHPSQRLDIAAVDYDVTKLRGYSPEYDPHKITRAGKVQRELADVDYAIERHEMDVRDKRLKEAGDVNKKFNDQIQKYLKENTPNFEILTGTLQENGNYDNASYFRYDSMGNLTYQKHFTDISPDLFHLEAVERNSYFDSRGTDTRYGPEVKNWPIVPQLLETEIPFTDIPIGHAGTKIIGLPVELSGKLYGGLKAVTTNIASKIWEGNRGNLLGTGGQWSDKVWIEYEGLGAQFSEETDEKVEEWLTKHNTHAWEMLENDLTTAVVFGLHKLTDSHSYLGESANYSDEAVNYNWSYEDFEGIGRPEEARMLQDFIAFAAENFTGLLMFRAATSTTRRHSIKYLNKLRDDAADDLWDQKDKFKHVIDYTKYKTVKDLRNDPAMIPILTNRAQLMHGLGVKSKFVVQSEHTASWYQSFRKSLLAEEAFHAGRLYTIYGGSELLGSGASAYAEHKFNIDRENPWNIGIEILATIAGQSIVTMGIRNFEPVADVALATIEKVADLSSRMYLIKSAAEPTKNFFQHLRKWIASGDMDGPLVRSLKIPDGKGGYRPLNSKEVKVLHDFVGAISSDPGQKVASMDGINFYLKQKENLIKMGVPEEEIDVFLSDVIKMDHLQDATAFMLDTSNLGWTTRNKRKIKTNMNWVKHFGKQLQKQNALAHRLRGKLDEITARYEKLGIPLNEEYEQLSELIVGKQTNINLIFNNFNSEMANYTDELLSMILSGQLKSFKAKDFLEISGDMTEIIGILKSGFYGSLSTEKMISESKDLLHSSVMSKVKKSAIDAINKSPLPEIQRKFEILRAYTTKLDNELNEITSKRLVVPKKEGEIGPERVLDVNATISSQRSVLSENFAVLIHERSKTLSRMAKEKVKEIFTTGGNPVTIDSFTLVKDLKAQVRKVTGGDEFAELKTHSRVKDLLSYDFSEAASSIVSKVVKNLAEVKGKQPDSIYRHLKNQTATTYGISPSEVDDLDIFLFIGDQEAFFRSQIDIKRGTFTLSMDLHEFHTIQSGVNRRIRAERLKPGKDRAEMDFLTEMQGIIARYEQNYITPVLSNLGKENYRSFKEWYKDTVVPFRHQNKLVPKVYVTSGIDRSSEGLKSVTGYYHDIEPTEWMKELVNLHIGETNGGALVINTLRKMFPDIKNVNGKYEMSSNLQVAYELLKRDLSLQLKVRVSKLDQKALGPATEEEIAKFLKNPRGVRVIDEEFDQLIEEMAEATGGKISFATLGQHTITKAETVKFIKDNTLKIKDASKATKHIKDIISKKQKNLQGLIGTLKTQLEGGMLGFNKLIETMEANPVQFFDYVMQNPRQLDALRDYAVNTSKIMTGDQFKQIVARQLARGISRKSIKRQLFDLEQGQLVPDPKYTGVVDEAQVRALKDKDAGIEVDQLLNIIDNETTRKVLQEYMPVDFDRLKVILLGMSYTKRPKGKGYGLTTDRAPRIDSAGVVSRGNAVAQRRSGIRFQVAEMLLAVFLRSEIDAVASLMLSKEGVEAISDMIIKGVMPPAKWNVSLKNKTGLWLPEVLALADTMGHDYMGWETPPLIPRGREDTDYNLWEMALP